MGRRAVDIEVILLDILAMVAFIIGQAKQTFLEDRVLAVPQGQGQAKLLLIIRNTGQAIFPPAVGAGASLVVTEVFPGVAGITIIFTNGSPLPLAEVRSPLSPGGILLASFYQSLLLCHAIHR